MIPSDEPGPFSRRLSDEQRQALLDVRHQIDSTRPPREFLQDLVTLISRILRAKAAVAGRHNGSWVLAAESGAAPAIAILSNTGPHAFDRFGATPGLRVELWRNGDYD